MERCQCPICGGTLEISLLSGEAVCEACGNRARVDFDRTKEYRRIYHEAEKAACLNTAAGYAEAIELLESISFVKEAKSKTADYQTRAQELRERQAARSKEEKASGKRDTAFGTVLIVLVILIVLAALVGAFVVVFRLVRGELSPQMTVAVIVTIAVLVIGAIIGKIKG